MLLSEQLVTADYQIKSYEAGVLIINDQIYTQSVLVTHNTLISYWPPRTLSELTIDDFAYINLKDYEILLIGTEQPSVFPPPPSLTELPLGYEIMSTLAACRTFNLLANEGRAVIAALLI